MPYIMRQSVTALIELITLHQLARHDCASACASDCTQDCASVCASDSGHDCASACAFDCAHDCAPACAPWVAVSASVWWANRAHTGLSLRCGQASGCANGTVRSRKHVPIIRHCWAVRKMICLIKSNTNKQQYPLTLLSNISNFRARKYHINIES